MSFDPTLAHQLARALSYAKDMRRIDVLGSAVEPDQTYGRNDVQIRETSSQIVVLFRGTQADNLIEFEQARDTELLPTRHGGQHAGFYRVFHDHINPGLSLMDHIRTRLDQSSKPIIFAGISRGGVLAQMAAVTYAQHERDQQQPSRIQNLYTFGQPMTGNEAFAATTRELLGGRFFRITTDDPVVHMPPVSSYTHAVDPLRIDLRINHQFPSFVSACISERLETNPRVIQDTLALWNGGTQQGQRVLGAYGRTGQLMAAASNPSIVNHAAYEFFLNSLRNAEASRLSCNDATRSELQAPPQITTGENLPQPPRRRF